MEHQFDELAKSLAEPVQRREALRRLGSGLATATLAVLGLGNARGQGRGGGGGSPGPQVLTCPTGQEPCGSVCCGVGEGCCVGPNGIPVCTTLGSNTNCSACNDVCPANASCVQEHCVCNNGEPPCPNPNGPPWFWCCPAGTYCETSYPGSRCTCYSNGQVQCYNICCPAGATCNYNTGQCVCTATGQPPCNGVCCPSGTSCVAGACTSPPSPTCPAGCSLEDSIEGQPVCVRLPSTCQGLKRCATSSTCGSTGACIPGAGCGWSNGEPVEYNACVPRC
jgi:hypothetical protein